jgi:hypothetical protein
VRTHDVTIGKLRIRCHGALVAAGDSRVSAYSIQPGDLLVEELASKGGDPLGEVVVRQGERTAALAAALLPPGGAS